MKTTLLILLVGLVAGANARHYINAESLLEAMKRYLGPEQLERREVRGIPVEGKVSGLDLLAEKRDTEICANCKAVPLTEAKEVADSCSGDTTEIAPVFEKPSGEAFRNLDCTCLKEYVCCPHPCPDMDTKQELCDQLQGCKDLDDYTGYYRFALLTDCCGCERRHIAKCPKPKTVVCNSCETHVAKDHLNELGCWEEGCKTTPEPIWPAPNCDAKCQTEIKIPAQCGFQKPACEGVPRDNCHPAEPEANVCRKAPTQIMQAVYTVGTAEGETCSECYKWSHPLIPTVHPQITCDSNCQTKVTNEDECGNKEDTCSTNEPHEPCHPEEPGSDICKHPWQKKDRDAFNFEDSTKTCSQCFEWEAEDKAIVKVTKECNDKCFSTMREDDDCGGWTESCEAKTCGRDDCRPAQPAQVACMEPAEQNKNTGDFCANGDGCDECWDWKAPTVTPCPTQLPTCHRYNAGLPDTCFEMITVEGECCDSKDCTKKEEQCVQKFATSDADAACPEGSVVLVGTSTCGTTRDLCYPCIKLELVDCDEACNDVQEVTNMVGCKEDRCVKKACPALAIPQNCAGTLGVSTNPCGCSIITCETTTTLPTTAISTPIGTTPSTTTTAATTSPPQPEPSVSIPNNFVCREGTNSCYRLMEIKRNWNGAQRWCRRRGALLAAIETADENAYLWSRVEAANGQDNYWWLGGTDEGPGQEGEWVWEMEDGNVPFSYTNWIPGQPDNHFIQNHLNFFAGANGKWDDQRQSDEDYFICEYHIKP